MRSVQNRSSIIANTAKTNRQYTHHLQRDTNKKTMHVYGTYGFEFLHGNDTVAVIIASHEGFFQLSDLHSET